MELIAGLQGGRGLRALVTNDDGIGCPGLHCLARAVAGAGIVPTILAPSEDMSGAGTGIGQFDPAEGVALRRAHSDVGEAYAMRGPPGLAVVTAFLGALEEPPDLVVSGINTGINTGHSVIHSGTVGAALTARTLGRSALAVSLAPSDPWAWDTAERVAEVLVGWLAAQRRDDVVLNVNVPPLPLARVRGMRWAPLADFGHIRVASADMEGQRLLYDVASRDGGGRADSDHSLLADGFVTVTPLVSVGEADADLPSLPEILV